MAKLIQRRDGSYFIENILFPTEAIEIYNHTGRLIGRYTYDYILNINNSIDGALHNIHTSILRTIFTDGISITINGFDSVRMYLLKRFIGLYVDVRFDQLNVLDQATGIDSSSFDINYTESNLDRIERINSAMEAGFTDMFHSNIRIAISRVNGLLERENYLEYNEETNRLTDNQRGVVVEGDNITNTGSNPASGGQVYGTGFRDAYPISSNEVFILSNINYEEVYGTRYSADTIDASALIDRITPEPTYHIDASIRQTNRRNNNKSKIKMSSLKYYPDRGLINNLAAKAPEDYYLPETRFFTHPSNNNNHIFFEVLVFNKEGKIDYSKIMDSKNIKLSNYGFRKIYLDLDAKSIIFFDNLPKDIELSETPDGVFYDSKFTEKEVGDCLLNSVGRKVYNNYIETTPKKVDFKYLKHLTTDRKSKIKYGEESSTYLITEGKRYTFGIEIETHEGYLPDYFFKEFNLIHTYDGSIKNDKGQKSGREFVTGVLKGDSGIIHLQKICNELARRTKVNKSCGEMLATL